MRRPARRRGHGTRPGTDVRGIGSGASSAGPLALIELLRELTFVMPTATLGVTAFIATGVATGPVAFINEHSAVAAAATFKWTGTLKRIAVTRRWLDDPRPHGERLEIRLDILGGVLRLTRMHLILTVMIDRSLDHRSHA